MNAPVDVDLKARALNTPLDDLDPSDPQIYYEDAWQPYFERFRKEAPVHRVKDSPYGPYWSVAKYKDIDRRIGSAMIILEHLKNNDGKIDYKKLYNELKALTSSPRQSEEVYSFE